MARTRDYADVIRKELADDPKLLDAVEAEYFNADIAMKLYQLRKAAGLTQKKLAELVGTKQSVISRIEDSDYEGHSLPVLRRIATALGKRLRILIEDYPTDAPDVEVASHQFEWHDDIGPMRWSPTFSSADPDWLTPDSCAADTPV